MEVLINGKNAFSCSPQEIKDAWALLKEAWNVQNNMLKRTFKIGDKVSFLSRKTGSTIVGYVKRINKKYIQVIPVDQPNTTWNVNPASLTFIEEFKRTK